MHSKVKPAVFIAITLVTLMLFPPVMLAQESNTSSDYTETMIVGRGGVSDTAWNPHGDQLAIAFNSGVWIYTTTFEEITHLSIPDELVSSYTHVIAVSWSPDGSQLAVTIRTLGQSIVQIWDHSTSSLTLRTTITHDFAPYNFPIAWNPDGTKIAMRTYSDIYNGSDIGIFDTATGEKIAVFKGLNLPLMALAWSPSNVYLAASDESNTIYLFDLKTGSVIHSLSALFPSSIAWNTIGTQLAVADGDTIQIWNISDFQPMLSLEGHSSEIMHIDWGSQGLASASYDSTVRIWDTNTGQSLQVLPGRAQSIDWGPDGVHLMTINSNQDIQIWDSVTGKATATFQKYPGLIHAFDWNAATGYFLSGGAGKLQIWDSRDGHLINTIQANAISISSVAFSPDGARFASGSLLGSVELWDTATGELLQTLEGYQASASINALSWNPDNRQLAGASNDKQRQDNHYMGYGHWTGFISPGRTRIWYQ